MMFKRTNKLSYRLCLLILLPTVLSACSNHIVQTPIGVKSENKLSRVETPVFNNLLFDLEANVISEEEILSLNESHKREFFKYMAKPEFANRPKHERLANYLELLMAGFEYTEKTNTASQTMEQRGGNCLSLTILTTAFAELANVEISYQLLESNPIYSMENNLLITSDHLRTVLKDNANLDKSKSFNFQRNIRIDFFPTDNLKYIDNIDPKLQASLYYSNVAAESVYREDYDQSFSYAKKALDIYQHNASALNTLGVLHRRKGDLKTAESIYQYGMDKYSRGLTFLRNYVYLLESQNRKTDSRELIESMSDELNDHPWQWIRAGRLAHKQGDLGRAIPYYQRALALAPDLHQLHLFTAKAYYENGERQKTKYHLKKAIDLVETPQKRKRYEQKLIALQ